MGHFFKDQRKRAFLNTEGADRPLKSPIPEAVHKRARAYRKQRLVDQVAKADCESFIMRLIDSVCVKLRELSTDCCVAE